MNLRPLAIPASIAAMLLSAFFTLGCGSSHTRVRLANMTPDESSLDMLVDGNKAASANFGTASAYVSVSAGTRHIQVEPSGTLNVLIDQSPSLTSGTDSTMFSLNFSSSIFPLLTTDDNSPPSSGNAKLRVVSGAPFLGSVDVYVITAGANISSTTPTFSSLGFGSASSYVSLGSGSYQVEFTLPGQKFAYIDTGVISLSSGQIRTVVGLNTANGYTAAILADLH